MSYQSFSSAAFDPSLFKLMPALPPPPGVTPNFTNPDSNVALVITIGSILLGIMVFFYAARVYVKHFIIQQYSWDDLTCAIAFTGSLIYFGATVWSMVGAKGPMGKHQWDLHLDRFMTKGFGITIYLSAVLAAPNLLALKLTFFLLYLQIFYHNVKLRVCIYAGAFLTTIFYMAVGITQFVLGTPPREVTWQDYVFLPGPRRLNTLSIPLAAVGLGIDLYILILPIGGVLQLQMPTRRKIGICLIFVIGIFACIASLLSIYYRVVTNQTEDRAWNVFTVNLLGCAELFIGVTCACMPSVSKMFHHHNSQVQKLMTVFSGLFTRLRSTVTKHGSQTATSEGKNTQMAAYYKHLKFVPLDDVVVSKISGGEQWGGLAEDVIHLKHDIRQEEHRM